MRRRKKTLSRCKEKIAQENRAKASMAQQQGIELEVLEYCFCEPTTMMPKKWPRGLPIIFETNWSLLFRYIIVSKGIKRLRAIAWRNRRQPTQERQHDNQQ
jgi:hypothetical protein